MLPLLEVDFNPVAEFTDFVHNPYVNSETGLKSTLRSGSI